MIRHCFAALPNEGCGLFAVSGDLITEVYPTLNAERSPARFTIPPAEHFTALTRAEARGWELGGSFHSHPRSGPEPSDRDLEQALEPEWAYLVVGLQAAPEIRAWVIREGVSTEVALVADRPSTAPLRRDINPRGGTVV